MFSPRFAFCNANGHTDELGEGVGLEICRVCFNILETKFCKFKFGCLFMSGSTSVGATVKKI